MPENTMHYFHILEDADAIRRSLAQNPETAVSSEYDTISSVRLVIGAELIRNGYPCFVDRETTDIIIIMNHRRYAFSIFDLKRIYSSSEFQVILEMAGERTDKNWDIAAPLFEELSPPERFYSEADNQSDNQNQSETLPTEEGKEVAPTIQFESENFSDSPEEFYEQEEDDTDNEPFSDEYDGDFKEYETNDEEDTSEDETNLPDGKSVAEILMKEAVSNPEKEGQVPISEEPAEKEEEEKTLQSEPSKDEPIIMTHEERSSEDKSLVQHEERETPVIQRRKNERDEMNAQKMKRSDFTIYYNQADIISRQTGDILDSIDIIASPVTMKEEESRAIVWINRIDNNEVFTGFINGKEPLQLMVGNTTLSLTSCVKQEKFDVNVTLTEQDASEKKLKSVTKTASKKGHIAFSDGGMTIHIVPVMLENADNGLAEYAVLFDDKDKGIWTDYSREDHDALFEHEGQTLKTVAKWDDKTGILMAACDPVKM